MSITSWSLLLIAGIMPLLVTGCRKASTEKEEEGATTPKRQEAFFTTSPIKVEETSRNRLQNEPSAFLRSRSEDPIHWQPWSPEILQFARSEQRPILAYVGSGQYSTCHELLDIFADPKNRFVDQFNEDYVCSLVDVDVHPEMALLSQKLSQQIGSPFSFPTLIWLSYEGNPITWKPFRASELDSLHEFMRDFNKVVNDTWRNDPRYIVENSRFDNENRAEIFHLEPEDATLNQGLLINTFITEAGRLTSLYDPISGDIDLIGILVPSDLLRFVALANAFPALPDYLRERSNKMLREVSDHLLYSAMMDPLDQGAFGSRRSQDWSIPYFTKPVKTQGGIATVFAHAYKQTNRTDLPAKVTNLFDYTDRTFGSGGPGVGLYESLIDPVHQAELYSYSLSELKELLGPKQFEAAQLAYGISKLGNVPRDQDRTNSYLHRNVLSHTMTPAQVAEALGMDLAEVNAQLSSIREKLLMFRTSKIKESGAVFHEPTRTTQANAAHAFSLYRSGRLLKNSELLSRGRETLTYLRTSHYSAKDGLWRIPPAEEKRGIKARGSDYAYLLLALMEAYRIELRPEDLAWAEDLLNETLRFLGDSDSLLMETPQPARINSAPDHFHSMIFEGSTWGTIYATLERFQRISTNQDFAVFAEAIQKRLLPAIKKAPLIHTDFLEGLLVPAFDCVAVLHQHSADSQQKSSLHQILLAPAYEGVTLIRQDALTERGRRVFTVPTDPGITLFRNGQALGTASSPEELVTLLESMLPTE